LSYKNDRINRINFNNNSKMKKISLLNNGIIFILFLFISESTHSQISYNIIPENSSMIIRGTSSLHDWQMEVKEMAGSAALLMNERHVDSILDTRFSCRTKSIVSDYRLMDKKTYEALKAEEYSAIHFRIANDKKIYRSGGSFSGEVTGYLSIAGVTKEIDVPFNGRILENGEVEVEGTVPLKMSEFNIDPPTALMGALKTDDEIRISYSLILGRDMGKEAVASMNSSNGSR
jgi:hypothetical protein